MFGAIVEKGRVVRDGNIITGGGVTAGTDFALAAIAEIFGQAVAEDVQQLLEYAPAPPFETVHPDDAPTETTERLRKFMHDGRQLTVLQPNRLPVACRRYDLGIGPPHGFL